MAQVRFIGYVRDQITTRRGEVMEGYNLFFLDKLRKGVGQFGCSKFVTDERLSDLDFEKGLPDLDTLYEVDFDRWGNFARVQPIV